MFVQIIQGQVSDAGQIRAALDRWAREIAPGAAGWLGSTAGVTEDGRFVALARFESEEAARANSNRPEQDRWWSEAAKLFTGAASFHDSNYVSVDIVDEPDAAGFVQVMRGHTSDPDRAWELMSSDSADWATFRPDLMATLAIGHDDGAYTMAFYFVSEEAAREGELKEPPPHLKAQMAEMDNLSVGAPEFFDLTQPWFYSPK
jgi:hypothetical protein